MRHSSRDSGADVWVIHLTTDWIDKIEGKQDVGFPIPTLAMPHPRPIEFDRVTDSECNC